MGKTEGKNWITSSDKMLEIILDFIDKVIPGQRFLVAGESYGGYLARGVVHNKMELVDGLLLLCPVVIPEQSSRNLPAHCTIKKDEKLIGSLKPEEAEGFRTMAVVENEIIWERYMLGNSYIQNWM